MTCGEGLFCYYLPEDNCGAADAMGVCEEMPEACTQEYAPVCGCDGETYGNACMAAGSGTSVLHNGECEDPEPVGCVGNEGCDQTDYCRFPETDSCGLLLEFPGECVWRPEACTQQYDPVCGCDGHTYGNACSAAAAGMNVVHTGECEDPQPEGCFGNEGCDETDYCLFPEVDACGMLLEFPGECVWRPEACTMQYNPVCGCDGRTYGNACMAAGNGVNVAQGGECEAQEGECGGFQGIECAHGQYCHYVLEQMCGAGDDMGVCQAIPEICTQEYAPVCGCDGRTHSNACMAAGAGVSVLHNGVCQE